MKKKNVIILLVTVATISTLYFVFMSSKSIASDNVELITTVAKRGKIVNSISATGTIEPVTQVEVGTQVSGILTKLYVDYNSIVKKGDVIAELDKKNLLIDLSSKQSSVNTAKSEYEYELQNYTRSNTLFEKDLVAKSQYDIAVYNYEKAKNNYDLAVSNLTKSETNLGYATIYSPIDGVVLSKDVEEGQTVASSFNTPTLFTIAADLTDMQVIADIDEADIGGVEVGQQATFTVDAFFGDEFEGVVTQIRQQGIMASNVVTYEVVISAPNPELKLKPGLTANITIYTMNERCEMVVPAKALKFQPQLIVNSEEKIVDELPADQPKVWIKEGNTYKSIAVTLGKSNRTITEVIGLERGTTVIVDASKAVTKNSSTVSKGASSEQEKSPFAPQRGGGGRRP